MIPQETVNKILDAAQIVDVVGDFVTLKKRGANHIACCPFHTTLNVPEDAEAYPYTYSGNNVDGFVVTIKVI